MSITDILIRSVSGYIFVVPVLLLYFLLMKAKRKQTLSHIITAFVFCYYIIGILTMTGINSFKPFSPRIVYIPFVDMIKDPVNTILNVILFLPLGIFLPLMYKKYNRIGRVAFSAFLISLTIELIQMFGMGATDINDLITNTVGACLGYLIYRLLTKPIRKEQREKFQAQKINNDIEVLAFVLYSLVIMLTIQPLVIHTLFKLG